jgi:DNA-binding NarL/FixJ family response regulator
VKLPRVLLADDHEGLMDSYRKLLASDCEVVATVGDGASALDAAERLKPDVAVMDVSMPAINGVEACRRLRKLLPGMPVILLSSYAAAAFVVGAFQAGACGYVLKHQAAEELAQAIRKAMAGEIHITPALHRQLWNDDMGGPERLFNLTESQRKLVTFIGQGFNTKRIAAVMGVAFKTVVGRRRAVMRRLQIMHTTDLARYAIRCRL